jgi:hypothetical protein
MAAQILEAAGIPRGPARIDLTLARTADTADLDDTRLQQVREQQAKEARAREKGKR